MNKYGETGTRGFWEMIAERDAAYTRQFQCEDYFAHTWLFGIGLYDYEVVAALRIAESI